ncbi:hypothetical protein PR202_ga31580 [Eleusine coracana subsp. coracana]|uniref:Protein kinase domain-containing protein n=1 Tax=Eleusine coracana subsp. coracana TaxID=191504 RepID=A0AAV5DRU0_ELECO|nr:hypothetical protein PR202_ga31580 [Eleusine coracana subsp. coracana]
MCEEANDVEDLEHVFKDANAKPVKISYAVLKSITKNFGQVIGRGGFGVVYLGELRNGMVAVKMLSTHMDLSDKSFSDEFGNLIRLKHKHIVRFLGYCAESQGEMMNTKTIYSC